MLLATALRSKIVVYALALFVGNIKPTPTLTQSILSKWRVQGTFIRHKDRDTSNYSLNNLCFVSLRDALDNIDTWTVDWTMNLTPQEIMLVRSPEWRSGLIL